MTKVTYQNRSCPHVVVRIDGDEQVGLTNFPDAEVEALDIAERLDYEYAGMEPASPFPCRACREAEQKARELAGFIYSLM